EINNPLGYVWSEFRSLRTIMNKYPKSDEHAGTVTEMVGAIEDGLSRIEKVVGSLLEYSRRGGRQQGTVSAYDLVKGINTALELSHGDYDRIAGIELDLQPLPELKAYGNEIDQVLLNIIRNAVDAIKERLEVCHEADNSIEPVPPQSGFCGSAGRPGHIRISCRVENDLVVCEIGNNGSPLDAGQTESIFNAFFSTKPGDRGTGLGLSISREIIEKHHGGRLTLSSFDPVVFRIELPINPTWPRPVMRP
ncbi:MAG: HAMP domain-containing sensor histidine kinase, partial [Spirochaetota bacterium]